MAKRALWKRVLIWTGAVLGVLVLGFFTYMQLVKYAIIPYNKYDRRKDVYRDRAEFLTVYISEAHPEDEWQMDSNVEDKIVFKQPKTFDERKTAAALLVDRLKYRAPLAVDGIDDKAGLTFGAWPERIYVIDAGGIVRYKGGLGPFGFHPDEAEKKLAEVVAR